jgi:hypothetical protein
MRHRKQIQVLLILLAIFSFCVFLTCAFFMDQLAAMVGAPNPDVGLSPVVMGLAGAGIAFVLYGLLGLAGYWFARKLNLPGIFHEDGNLRRQILLPGLLGLTCGLALVIGDLLFARCNGIGRFPHPPFPASIVVSLTAGIGEEIAFRAFVLGLWALLLTWLFKRFPKRTAILWMANVLAALAFAAGHLPAVVILTGASSIGDLNPVLLSEIFLLNGIVALVAGQRYLKDGLVAAAGVHFWTDIVFHVGWGLLAF